MKAKPPLLASFWFGIQLVWGAVLAVSLQARSIELAHQGGVGAYALIAAFGAALGAGVQLAVGPLSDRVRARTGSRIIFYAAGSLSACMALVWFFLARSFAELLAAFLLLQVTFNFATGPYQAVIPDYIAPQRVGEASSWMAIFTFLGNSAGLVIAGFIKSPIIVATLLGAAILVSCTVTFLHARQLRTMSAASEPLRVETVLQTLLISRGFINIGFYTLMGFLFFYVRDSLTAANVRSQTAILFLIFTLCGVVGAALAARPADTYDKRLVVSVANVIILFSLMLLATAHSMTVAHIAAGSAGVAYGAFFTADWSIACALFPEAALGAAMGLWNIATAVPQIIAPIITAPLVLRFNALQPGWGPRSAVIAATVEFTIGTLWLWRIPRNRFGSKSLRQPRS